jgi:hypothetical protein
MTTNKYGKSAKKRNMAEICVFTPAAALLYDFIVDLGTALGGNRDKVKEEIINETLSSLPGNYAICWRDWGSIKIDGSNSFALNLANVYIHG